jgi:hypothetical protein
MHLNVKESQPCHRAKPIQANSYSVEPEIKAANSISQVPLNPGEELESSHTVATRVELLSGEVIRKHS